MANSEKFGERLIGRLIDEYAVNDPNRVWASIPVDNNDLAKGFQDINYFQFANAINHAAWWLKKQLSTRSSKITTVAYAGPKDLRYPVIAVAVLKLEKKLLLCSPFATKESQNHLLSSTETKVYFHAKELRSLIESVVSENPEVSAIEVPEQNKWLFNGETASRFVYNKTWEEAHADPWLIFHTSGTTGFPKPLIYTNWMMTSFDAAELMPSLNKETMNDQFRDKRFYVSMPTLHFVGMTAALQWTVFLNTVLVLAPPGNTDVETIIQTLQQGKALGAVMVPSQIEATIAQPSGLKTLYGLSYIYFAGSALPKSIASHLVGHVKVQPGMGTTEGGAYFVEIRNEDDWEYYQFRESMGIEMVPRTKSMYELVFKRQEKFKRWQQIFHLYPDLKEYSTKDLWTRHPTRLDLWKYAGRADDLVNLTHGESLYATPIEDTIQEHPDVRVALVGGEGRYRPFVIIELTSEKVLSDQEKEEQIEIIWPNIERANARCTEVVKLSRERVLFTDPTKPLPRTAKDTVMKSAATKLYQAEIDTLYRKANIASR